MLPAALAEPVPAAHFTVTNSFPQTIMFSSMVFMEAYQSSSTRTSPYLPAWCTSWHGGGCDLCKDGPPQEVPLQEEVLGCCCHVG